MWLSRSRRRAVSLILSILLVGGACYPGARDASGQLSAIYGAILRDSSAVEPRRVVFLDPRLLSDSGDARVAQHRMPDSVASTLIAQRVAAGVCVPVQSRPEMPGECSSSAAPLAVRFSRPQHLSPDTVIVFASLARVIAAGENAHAVMPGFGFSVEYWLARHSGGWIVIQRNRRWVS